MIAAMNS